MNIIVVVIFVSGIFFLAGYLLGKKWGYDDGFRNGYHEHYRLSQKWLSPEDLRDGAWYWYGPHAIRYEQDLSLQEGRDQYVFTAHNHPEAVDKLIALKRSEIKHLKLG